MPADPIEATERLRRLNALLESALAQPVSERQRWLGTLPPEHRALVPALRALLARAGVETDTFLRRPLDLPTEELPSFELRPDVPGDCLGPYRLIEELGRGGMATVWLAERSDGALQRQVALKLPRSGWGAGLAQRMARERDILAALEHPRIARLYDAGVTPAGRPWLAMERVEGTAIDDYCAGHQLSVAQRLQLFLQVADAVAYAHTRLTVHRDLKPSNILVTAMGEIRLLDFGVAKLMQSHAAAGETASNLTQQLGWAVTPDYAAPEQVSDKPVGVATDVYSLGVVLYELLTGQRPYRIQAASVATLEAAIRAAHVEPPSMRVASNRALARQLRGDLDTIVLKALDKEPLRRYASVESLAADIQRHLAGQAVLARPPSRSYRSFKFVHRHRLAVASLSAVTLAVVAGLGTALWQARQARTESARAEQVKQFIASIFRQARPREGEGGVVTASGLLAAAALRIQDELASNVPVATELDVIVAEGFNELGEPEKGEAALRAALLHGEPVLGRQHPLILRAKGLLVQAIDSQDIPGAQRVLADMLPDVRARMPATADLLAMALHSQSYVLAKLNQAQESYAALKEGIAVAEKYLGPAHEQTLLSMGLLANTYGRFDARDEELRVATEALQRGTAALGTKRPNGVLISLERWYADALNANDRPADAVPILRRVLRDTRHYDAAETNIVRHAMHQLAVALDKSGQQAEALATMRAAVAMEALHHPKDSDDRVGALNGLQAILTNARQVDEALQLDERIETIARQLGTVPQSWELARDVRRARLLAWQGHFDAAARAALGVAERAGGRFARQRADATVAAALNARLRGHPTEAMAFAQQVLSDPDAAKLPLELRAAANAEQGLAWLDMHDFAKAEEALNTAMERRTRAQIDTSPRIADMLVGMARVHLHAGRAAQAEENLHALADAWAGLNPGSPWHGEALYWLAQAEAMQGKASAAREHRHAANAMLKASPLPALRALAS